MEMRLKAGPPSPQSLQPQYDEADGSNPHKKLTHTSSLSAPEVNRVRVACATRGFQKTKLALFSIKTHL